MQNFGAFFDDRAIGIDDDAHSQKKEAKATIIYLTLFKNIHLENCY